MQSKVAAGIVLGVVALSMNAQRKIPMPDEMPVNNLTEEEYEPFLDQLRYARLQGDYSFRFRLEHFPREGEERTYRGILWGTWMSGSLTNRIHLETPKETRSENGSLQLLQRTGVDPQLWLRRDSDEVYQPTVEESHEPLVEGLTFSSFEMQMPFLFWEDYTYEDSIRLKGRPAHVFLMHAPEKHLEAGVAGVRIFVDEAFHALLRAEVINPNGAVSKTIKVLSFKRVSGQWIVKSIDLIDEGTRDKTRFTVLQAAVGLNLPYAYFLPTSLITQTNPVPEEAYKVTY